MKRLSIDPKIIKKKKTRNQSTNLIPSLHIPQKEIDERFKYYFGIPQPAQKSQEWLDQRTNYITASAFGHTLEPKWKANRNELLKNKVSKGSYNSFKGNEATRWGEKYEDVANAIYCYRQGVTVEEFGLIPHPDFPFLGASTDGISSKMINLEIKCPFSRVIEPGKVKDIYWKQMQLQMAVLDLELTHFFECTLHEYPTERDFWMDFNYEGFENPEKGIVIEIVDHSVTNLADLPKTCYVYSPIRYCEDEDKLRRWHKKEILRIITSSHQIYIRSHFWIAKVVSCVNVFRDRDWFNAQIPKFCEFWEEVKSYRENGGLEKLEKDIEMNKSTKKRTLPVSNSKPKISIEIDSDEGLIPDDYLLNSSEDQSVKPGNQTKKLGFKTSKGGVMGGVMGRISGSGLGGYSCLAEDSDAGSGSESSSRKLTFKKNVFDDSSSSSSVKLNSSVFDQNMEKEKKKKRVSRLTEDLLNELDNLNTGSSSRDPSEEIQIRVLSDDSN